MSDLNINKGFKDDGKSCYHITYLDVELGLVRLAQFTDHKTARVLWLNRGGGQA